MNIIIGIGFMIIIIVVIIFVIISISSFIFIAFFLVLSTPACPGSTPAVYWKVAGSGMPSLLFTPVLALSVSASVWITFKFEDMFFVSYSPLLNCRSRRRLGLCLLFRVPIHLWFVAPCCCYDSHVSAHKMHILSVD